MSGINKVVKIAMEHAISIAAVLGVGIFWGALTHNCLENILWLAQNPDNFEEEGEE